MRHVIPRSDLYADNYGNDAEPNGDESEKVELKEKVEELPDQPG
jgi:hypothetical protein